MTPKDPLAEIVEASEKLGSVAAFARGAGFAPSYVHDVLRKRRPPSDDLLKALGLERVVVAVQPPPKPITVEEAELSVRTSVTARRVWGSDMLLSDLIAKTDEEIKAAGLSRKSIREIREIGAWA